MKRITIRRNKKAPEKPPQEPDAPDESSDETSEYESDDTEAITEPPTKQLRNLKVSQQRELRPRAVQKPVRRESRSANIVERQSFPVQPPRQNAYDLRNQRREFARPRSINYEHPRKQRSGRRNLHYRSIYGPNSHLMSTQDKARQLYFAAFE